MPFLRALVSPTGNMPTPLREGDGFISNVTPTVFNTETDETITMNQLSGGSILQGLTLTSDVTYTLPTAADIAAEWPEMDVGDAFTFYVANNQSTLIFEVIIAVAAGITTVGTNNDLAILAGGGKMFTLKKTGAATFDLY